MSEHNHDCNCGHDHHHDHDHECGCGHDHGEEALVTLTLDDGSVLECVVLTIFQAGDKDYIALLPVDAKEDEEAEVFLYRFKETPEGEPELENIEDDAEYEIVADAFDELLDAEEYEELALEEDE